MQIGVITVDGQPVGVVSLSEGLTADAFTPDLDGSSPEGRTSEHDVLGHFAGPQRSQHHQPGRGSAHARHHDTGHPETQRARFGGEGDTDPPVERRHDTPSVRIEPGDRVHGEFAAGRERARTELAAKPWLRDKVLRIAANEQGSNPYGTQAVLESLVNRSVNRGTSIEKEARWHRSEGGYYDEGSMGRGALEDAGHRAMLEHSLERVLAGSNITGNATDNSSGSLAAREKATGKFRHHRDINGESFFSPGHAEPALRDKWQRQNYAAETAKTAEANAAKRPEAEKLASGEIAP